MSIKLQVAECKLCKGYHSSTILNSKDINHPDIVDHYFYHGEPWFTLNQKTFSKAIDSQHFNIRVVDFSDHIRNDKNYCRCREKDFSKTYFYYQKTNDQQKISAYLQDDDFDTLFRDLYIIYNNIHQDVPARQAV